MWAWLKSLTGRNGKMAAQADDIEWRNKVKTYKEVRRLLDDYWASQTPCITPPVTPHRDDDEGTMSYRMTKRAIIPPER